MILNVGTALCGVLLVIIYFEHEADEMQFVRRCDSLTEKGPNGGSSLKAQGFESRGKSQRSTKANCLIPT